MSALEETLAFQIKAIRLPAPEREFKAVEGRKFKWDFAWPDHSLLLEIQGQIWRKGGHTTGTGILRDMEKLNLAVLNGWRVLQVAREHIESGQAVKWVQQALSQHK